MVESRNELVLLSIDSATRQRSVALSIGARLVSLTAGENNNPGSANILCEIDRALSNASLKISDVDIFAVTIGPGSFTSLRAGLATVKAFAATLKKPLVGIQTLHAIAHAAKPGQHIQAIIPAGRGELFTQNLSVTSDGELTENDAPCHVSTQALIEMCAKSGGAIKWAGITTDAIYDLIKQGAEVAGIRLVVQASGTRHPETGEWMIERAVELLAPSVAALAYARYIQGLSVNAGQLRALYVRESGSEFKMHVTRKD